MLLLLTAVEDKGLIGVNVTAVATAGLRGMDQVVLTAVAAA
jgi:hypothetical protein